MGEGLGGFREVGVPLKRNLRHGVRNVDESVKMEKNHMFFHDFGPPDLS